MLRTLALLLLTILFSCGDSGSPDSESASGEMEAAESTETASSGVSHSLAKGWFVRNDFPDMPLMSLVLETQASFDEVLGAAATMGPDGKPTATDFSKRFAIALIAPETDTATTLEFRSLESRDGQLHLAYHRILGERQSFTTRPLLLLFVERSSLAPVVLEESWE